MAFKLVVGNALDVRVKGEVQGERGTVAFNFVVRMNRLNVADYRRAVAPDSDVLVRDFLRDNALGWSGQRLVLDEGDEPAQYSPEALDVLLTVVGMEQAIFAAYVQALGVANTPKGAAGN